RTYTVTLVVWDDHNATASFQRTISVVPPKPPFAVLAFTPSRPFVGDAVSFNGSLSDDPDGTIVRYVWQFGDGAGGEGAALTHRYTYPGEYTVRLAVVDEAGFAATTSSDITAISQPTAAFTVSPNSTHASENPTFTATGVPVGMMAIWAIVAVGAAVVAVGIYVRRRTHPPKL